MPDQPRFLFFQLPPVVVSGLFKSAHALGLTNLSDDEARRFLQMANRPIDSDNVNLITARVVAVVYFVLDALTITWMPLLVTLTTILMLEHQLATATTIGILLGTAVISISVAVFWRLENRRLLGALGKLRLAMLNAAAGHPNVRVHIARDLAKVGDAFNTMATYLVELQEHLKRSERQAMFGRATAGLVHDLSHPIQNLGNTFRLLMRDNLDFDERQRLRDTVERELAILKRFMDDLLNVVEPRAVERFALDVNPSLAEVVEGMRQEADGVGVRLEAYYAPQALVIDGNPSALGHVYRQLMMNAIQATPPGGRVTVTTKRVRNNVEIKVTDTGSGIPPERLSGIFADFVSTKHHGLGLGLAIAKRIVDQLNGSISVTSEVGRGSAFSVTFPVRVSEYPQRRTGTS